MWIETDQCHGMESGWTGIQKEGREAINIRGMVPNLRATFQGKGAFSILFYSTL
jgi:hypothetical protein